jgi:tetratricopeptide (TPR) repeat protein
MSKRGWSHVDDPIAVGTRLKDARLAAGMSQRALSFPGCTAVYICRIERGDRVPSLQVLRELARRVGVSEEYLATGSEALEETDPLLDADVALRLSQFELAEHLYTQTLERTTDRVHRARALGGLGQIDFHAGRLEDAVERLEEARALLAGSIAGYPGIVDSLARVYWMRDEYEVAIAVLEEALGLARTVRDELAETRFSVLLANVLIDSGSLSSARELLGKTLAQSARVTDPIVQAQLYWSQSRLHSAENNPEVALRYARMALASIELTDHTAYAARAHHLLAYIELELGNAPEALELLERGYPLAVSGGGAEARGLFSLEKARALAALGRDEEAVALAIEVADELAESQPEQAGRAYAVAADVFARTGESARGLELYERSVELVSERHPDFVRDVYGKMAELLEADGRKDEALELLKRAVGLQGQVPQGQA